MRVTVAAAQSAGGFLFIISSKNSNITVIELFFWVNHVNISCIPACTAVDIMYSGTPYYMQL